MATLETHGVREPPRTLGGLLRNVGPGVVVAGSVVGAGELLVTPRVGAQVGFIFLWGVVFACLAKFFIQLELGRQCILHNRTTIQILDRIPGPRFRNTSWLVWLCIAGYLSVTLTLIGILGSVSGVLAVIFPGMSPRAWAVVVFVVLSILLWRGLYKDLEKMVMTLVASFSLVVVTSLLLLQGTPYAITAPEIVSGFGFALPADGAFVALALMGAVGTTAVELFMYPYWVKEKGYPEFVGPQEDTPEWRARYRGWMRVLTTDALVCTCIALFVTCVYYLLGAAVLARLKVLPEGVRVVEQVSLIFTKSFGDWAFYVFMVGALCTLFATLLVFSASSGRIGADFLRQIGVGRWDAAGRAQSAVNWMRTLQIAFPLLWLSFILVDLRTLDFVLKGANANNMFLIPLAYGVLHLAMRTPTQQRMSLGVECSLLFTIWAILNFTVTNLFHLFTA
ncbi:Nramp family divalent metal transporter [Steroidobacter flavus]|uniref:Nramp family divalent metal transporter n=1 Tax=Steroidobacter flavus TaxID=1842136 RepID=A0ABV8SZD8_9GAMM